jgi:hypothetical protein
VRLRFIGCLILLACLGAPGVVRAQGLGSFEVIPARPPRQREGFLLIPFVGIHSLQSYAYQTYDRGLRVGALAGGFTTPSFSMNGGVSFDLHNPAALPGIARSGRTLDIFAAPLFHVGDKNFEAVLGPKVGGFATWNHVRDRQQTLSVEAFQMGILVGAQLGLFAAITERKLVGLMLSFDYRESLDQECTAPVDRFACVDLRQSATTWGATLAAML